jgi:hypothetical protein
MPVKAWTERVSGDKRGRAKVAYQIGGTFNQSIANDIDARSFKGEASHNLPSKFFQQKNASHLGASGHRRHSGNGFPFQGDGQVQ